MKKIILIAALSLIAATAWADPGFLKRHYDLGRNRICVYDSLGDPVAITIRATQICPPTLDTSFVGGGSGAVGGGGGGGGSVSAGAIGGAAEGVSDVADHQMELELLRERARLDRLILGYRYQLERQLEACAIDLDSTKCTTPIPPPQLE